ncbi:MAG: hypothetical protein NW217_13250 [Hyphomicrobiaceae bacterium]|nr:hypothetical protein [Hyphomicrobiaceae bacterium]
MTDHVKLKSRPIPTLCEMLGDGARADGFEDWVRECHDIELSIDDPLQRAMIRMQRLLSVAMVEALNREAAAGDVDPATAINLMARLMGVSLMAAVLSDRTDDAVASMPVARFARMIGDDVAFGARSMALATKRQPQRKEAAP